MKIYCEFSIHSSPLYLPPLLKLTVYIQSTSFTTHSYNPQHMQILPSSASKNASGHLVTLLGPPTSCASLDMHGKHKVTLGMCVPIHRPI